MARTRDGGAPAVVGAAGDARKLGMGTRRDEAALRQRLADEGEIKEALADELKAERSKANAVRRQLETARAKLRVLQAPDRMVADGAELQVPFWATFLSSAAMFIIGAVVGKGGNARVGIKL